MKKILILGAGVYQIPLIKRAKEREFHVIAASSLQTDVITSFVDEFVKIDTTDKLNLFKYSQEAGIDAVTTTGTDVAIPSIGFICNNLQLPGISENTAYLATNKIAMKNKFKEYNVPTPGFLAIENLDELYSYASIKGFPFVVKAPDSSGSRGLTIVNNFNELNGAYHSAMNVSRYGSIIAEENLRGKEYSASIVVVKNEVVECFIRNKTVTKPPVKVTLCASCPATLSPDIQDKIKEVCELAVKSLNIEDGICESDIIVTDEGVKMIELGARLGSIGAPEIIKLYYDVDLYDATLDFAMDKTPIFQKKQLQPAAYHIIPSPKSGLLQYQSFRGDILNNPDIISIDFDYSLGTQVREFRTGPDRIGNILVTGTSSDEAEKTAAEVLRSIRIQVAPEIPSRDNRSAACSS